MCHTVKQPRGLACVVSNTTFDASTTLNDRNGGKVDLKNITALFKELGFEVRELYKVDKGTADPAVPDSGSLLPSDLFQNAIGQDEADVEFDQPNTTDMLICYPTQLDRRESADSAARAPLKAPTARRERRESAMRAVTSAMVLKMLKTFTVRAPGMAIKKRAPRERGASAVSAVRAP
ncbi:Hypp7650 [Branchiostoma lanceolatum]|uniref:Hypp7650 protein n=1 Tax=Branchiostoma lanceolatum TaxID=7740 RepID=A0A8J9Z2Q9_BRALA|nr:Hypp7650 [Branchiostoma lanceolatum]